MIEALIDWGKRHLQLLIVIGSVGAAGGAVAGFYVWDYTQNDPNFCTSCHLMEDAFGVWAKSAHKEVNCHTCHPGDLATNLHQLWQTVTAQPTKVTTHAEVPATICGSCHLSGDSQWEQVKETAGHALHWGKHEIECVTCHAPSVHEFEPTDQMCAKCHEGVVVALSEMNRNHCTNCHDFLVAPEEGLAPDEARCGGCHAQGGRTDLKAHWHDGQPCAVCHPVHDEVGLDRPDREGAAVACDTCHMERDVGPHFDCAGCHRPHDQGEVEQRCRECHEGPGESLPPGMNHECADCHPPHEHTPTCADCHRDQVEIQRATRVEKHRECIECHRQHEPGAPDGPACARCHEKQARRVATAPSWKHRRCASCHQVHQPEDPRCSACHKEEREAVKGAPKKHRDCANCHPSHGQPAVGEATCAQCHKTLTQRAAAGPAEHRGCTECHSPHEPAKPDASACVRCHEGQVGQTREAAPEHRDCLSCHKWHEATLKVSTSACGECHTKEQRNRIGHMIDCGRCHPPHREKEVARCGQCHGREADGAARSRIDEHRDCKSCHPATHGLPPEGCLGCHPKEGARGLHRLSKHQECLDCHTTHPPERPTADRCIKCHENPDGIAEHPPEARGAAACQGCHNFRREKE